MDFKFDLNLVHSQKLLLTPKLKQALEILRMNNQELSAYIDEQIEVNPVIELFETDSTEDVSKDRADLNEWDDGCNLKESGSVYAAEGEKDPHYWDNFGDSTFRLSLKEHLLFQLHTSSMDNKDIIIAEYLIDNIDENGYLKIGAGETAKYFNTNRSRINNILEQLYNFDPPGIFARDLKECLLLQLRQLQADDPQVVKIIEAHLDDVAANRVSLVARKTGMTIKKISQVFNIIKSLEPRPGRDFYDCSSIKYIVPDIRIIKIKNNFEVIFNEESHPLININGYYKNIVEEDINKEAKKFILSRLDNAIWLIKCIEQRKNTVRRIAECILKRQPAFFEKGREFIKPMTMNEIAEEIDMHESTVSRTVNDKYIECQWGTFEMKFFFTGRILDAQGKGVSTEVIKIKIGNLIKNEDKGNPLSDADITLKLKEDGIELSRRTVSKYRGLLEIPSAQKRKKY